MQIKSMEEHFSGIEEHLKATDTRVEKLEK
jgi:hypothetical protein